MRTQITTSVSRAESLPSGTATCIEGHWPLSWYLCVCLSMSVLKAPARNRLWKTYAVDCLIEAIEHNLEFPFRAWLEYCSFSYAEGSVLSSGLPVTPRILMPFFMCDNAEAVCPRRL